MIAHRNLATIGDQHSSQHRLHAEHAELRRRDRRVEAGRQAKRQRLAGPRRIDDAVVPEARGGVVGRSLALVLLEDRLPDGAARRRRSACLPSRASWSRLTVASTRGRLFAAHHRDARVRPHPEEPRIEGAAAHPVVAGTERSADDDGELRDDRVGDGVHHLRAVLGDAAALVLTGPP